MGDSAAFDFVLAKGGRKFRVQVKSGREGTEQIDFSARVIPLNITYMVPVEALEKDQKYL